MSTALAIAPNAERDADGRSLIALYHERCELAAAMAAHDSPTGSMAAEVLAKGAELDQACEAYRRRWFPRRARVFVGLYRVCVASATLSRVDVPLDLFGEYSTTERPGIW